MPASRHIYPSFCGKAAQITRKSIQSFSISGSQPRFPGDNLFKNIRWITLS